MKCAFDEAYLGRCKQEAINGKYCKYHSTLRCVECSKQAIRQCEEASSLVCGAPLCARCKHKTRTWHG